MELKKVKEPDSVEFYSNANVMRYPITYKKGKETVKEVLNFKENKVTLNKEAQKGLIDATRIWIDEQWLKNEDGSYMLTATGNRMLAPGKILVPFWEHTAFEDSVVKGENKVIIPDGDGTFVEISSEQIQELVKNSKLKEKK